MAEYFVGRVMDKIIDACSEYFKDQVRGKADVEEELKKLRFIHPQIQAVVSVYNQSQNENLALNKWYWQLRDAIDEADDVLDEIEYWKLQKPEISKNKGKRRAEVPVGKLYENLKLAIGIGKRAPESDPNLKKLEEAVHKLHEISAQVSAFLHILDSAKQEEQQQQFELHKKRETGSVIKNVLLGRIKEMEFITQWLRDPYEAQSIDTADLYKNISLLCVVGHGGMGKTSLLQHTYQDANLNKDAAIEVFDVKMWACVSQNFDARTVIKNILESLLHERPNLDTIEALQSRLQSQVKSKRFLLVLDDIWEEDDAKWENVLGPLQHGSSGSKIVITTRLDLVATKFANLIKKRKETLPLKALEEEECLELFNSHAFAGVENPDDEFKSIAGKMVKKLSGCPLAIKVIGGILNSYIDKSYWIKILNTTIGKVGQGQNHLLPILKLSYIYLPKILQNCFSFCCIFPQDYAFDKDDLVRMWIALGFIESSNIQEETLEDTGRRYFNILVKKSFFDEFRRDSGIIYYKMHDLLHELAQFVAAHECLTIVGDKAFPIPPTTRHLSVNDISSLEPTIKKLGEFKNLRSLFLSYSGDAEFYESYENVICEILKASKSIRLLAIAINFKEYSKHILYKIPEEIGCLIHLRYLKVKCFDDFKLPRSISHLYHLEFMILCMVPDFKFGWKELMPNENCQLILDSLAIKDPSATNLIMEPLRRISSFRRLEFESNDKLVSFPSETKQLLLQHSSSLFELSFYDLQSLESLPSSLECLSSLLSLSVVDVPQLKLLPNPPASLVELELSYLPSLQCLPSSLSTISSLRSICLQELENLDCLPSCLPTRLRELFIIKVPLLLELPDLPSSMEWLLLQKLKSLKCLPSSLSTSSLKTLYLKDLESLECQPSSLSTISSLTDLKLKNIQLKSLPDLPSSLKKLVIKDLKSLSCLPSSLSTFSSLTILKLIGNIPLLESLPNLPSSLKELVLNDLESLQFLPSFSAISSLESLKLIRLPLFNLLPDFPSSLKKLLLDDLESLQSLPSFLSAISSLESLELKKLPLLNSLECQPSALSTFSSLTFLKLINIPLLESLPDLPTSLKELVFEDLESLQCLPSSLSTITSLTYLSFKNIPPLKSMSDLPSSLLTLYLVEIESLQCLPSSLSTFSSLTDLTFKNIPLFESLPDLPSSLKYLKLEDLKLQCLPSSLCTISSLTNLSLKKISLLKSLPDLPSSLKTLSLENLKLKNIPLKSLPDLPSSLKELLLVDLESLQCLPSSLSTISSLKSLELIKLPLLKSLPDLPSSLRILSIHEVPGLLELPALPASLKDLHIRDCQPQLMERYPSFSRGRKAVL